MWGQSPIELFQRGGPVMWPLLGCLVFSLAVILERLVIYAFSSGSFRWLVENLEQPIRQKALAQAHEVLERSRSPAARVAEAYVAYQHREPVAREELVACEASQRLVMLETRLTWLSIIGHLAPMLGLLGTVTGLIEAFHEIENRGGRLQPTDLAQGIWSALLTTVAGLIVALPTLAVHRLMQRRVSLWALQMRWIVAYLHEWTGADVPPRKTSAHHRARPTSLPSPGRALSDGNLPSGNLPGGNLPGGSLSQGTLPQGNSLHQGGLSNGGLSGQAQVDGSTASESSEVSGVSSTPPSAPGSP